MLSFPLTVDEGAYSYIVYFWQHGEKLYHELWLDRPQGIFVIYRFVFNTLGTSTESIRFFAAAYNSLTVAALGILGKKLFGWQAGSIAAILYAIYSSGIATDSFIANTEVFMNLPIVASTYFLVRIINQSDKNLKTSLMLSGLFAAIPFLIKGSGVAAFLFAIIYITYLKAPYKYFLLGFITGLMPAFLHGFTIGINKYLWAIVGWRVFEYKIFSDANPTQFFNLIFNTANIIPEWSLLVVLFVIWMLNLRKTTSRQKVVLVAFLTTSMFGVAMGGHWLGHYFIQLIPPMSLIGGAAIFLFFNYATNKKLASIFLLYISLVGIIIFLVLNWIPLTSKDTVKIASYAFNNRLSQYDQNASVSKYITERTNDGDKIHIFFDQTQIYYLTKRMPAYYITFIQPALRDPNFDENLTTILSAHNAPKYIILNQRREYLKLFPKIQASIKRHYFLEHNIEGIEFYRRRID